MNYEIEISIVYKLFMQLYPAEWRGQICYLTKHKFCDIYQISFIQQIGYRGT